MSARKPIYSTIPGFGFRSACASASGSDAVARPDSAIRPQDRGFGTGIRAPWRRRRPGRVEELSNRLQQMLPLVPAGNVVLRRRTARHADQAAHRVPQETDVRGKVDVGLGHEEVNAPAQGRARLLSATAWPLSTISLLTSTRSPGSGGSRCPPASGACSGARPTHSHVQGTGAASCARLPARGCGQSRSPAPA